MTYKHKFKHIIKLSVTEERVTPSNNTDLQNIFSLGFSMISETLSTEMSSLSITRISDVFMVKYIIYQQDRNVCIIESFKYFPPKLILESTQVTRFTLKRKKIIAGLRIN